MILADAGVLLAAANQDEDEHEACASLLEQAIGGLGWAEQRMPPTPGYPDAITLTPAK